MTSVKKSLWQKGEVKQQMHTLKYSPGKSTFAEAAEADVHVSVLPSCAEYA